MTAHGNSAGRCMRLAPSLPRGHTAHASLPSHSITKGLRCSSQGPIASRAKSFCYPRTERAVPDRLPLNVSDCKQQGLPAIAGCHIGMCLAFRYVQLHQALNACADASGTTNSQAAHCSALADSSGTREGLAVPPVSDALCECRAIPTERFRCRASERCVWLCD